jgi:ABC-type Fe3+-hydroxamate transport system, periplasmic component
MWVALLVVAVLGTEAAQARQVVDLAGRKVTVPDKVERIVLGEGRFLQALAIVEREDPLKRVVGTMGEFAMLDPGSYARWQARFPRLAEIPSVGKSSGDTFSVEQAIALSPQVAVFGLAGHGPGPQEREVLDRLEAAGIAVIFVDFFRDPLLNAPGSVALLGELLGREREAAEYVSAFETELRRVTERLATVQDRPLVFLENRVGLQDDCCASVGDGMVGRMIERAGGRNLGSNLIPGTAGTLSLEYLLTNQPDIYVGTAIGSVFTMDRMPNRVVAGAGVPAETARASFARSLSRPGIRDLDAVRQGRAHTLWHHFFHSPFNVVALQVMAKWFHPRLFDDLDPAATLKSMQTRFQPPDLAGTYWLDAP